MYNQGHTLSRAILTLAGALLTWSVSFAASAGNGEIYDVAASEMRVGLSDGTVSELVSDDAPEERTPQGWDGFRLELENHDAYVQIHGLLHSDFVAHARDDEDAYSDRFFFRRGRVSLYAEYGGRFAFSIEPQFTENGVNVVDAYVDLRIVPNWLNLRVGKMKTPLGVEMVQSITALVLPERGLSTQLVPFRDQGVYASGRSEGELIGYGFGIGNGVPDGTLPRPELDDHFEFYGHTDLRPLTLLSGQRDTPQLMLRMAFSAGMDRDNIGESAHGTPQSAAGRPLFTITDDLVADGMRYRLNPQLTYYHGPVGVLGEYVRSSQELRDDSTGQRARIDNDTWLVAAQVVLTGEDANYGLVRPERRWGAVDLTFRYSELMIDESMESAGFVAAQSVNNARALGVGVNYYPNPIFRISMSYEHTEFERDRDRVLQPENLFTLRAQTAF